MVIGLRAVTLLSPSDRQPVILKPGRGALVWIVVHGDRCTECREYVRKVWDKRHDIFQWEERLTVVVREPGPDYPDFGIAELDVLLEGNPKLSFSGTGLIIADEWGDIFHATAGHHRFLSEASLAEWLRFVAMQCPECEQPEGPWREILLRSDI